MKVVVDTNVVLSALMRAGFTRTLLVHPGLDLVMPEYALEELRRHLPALSARLGLGAPQARLTLDLLLGHVATVPHEEYAKHMPRAEELVKEIDPDDAPFVALALATGLTLWTQDKALVASPAIPTATTHDVADRLGFAAG